MTALEQRLLGHDVKFAARDQQMRALIEELGYRPASYRVFDITQTQQSIDQQLPAMDTFTGITVINTSGIPMLVKVGGAGFSVNPTSFLTIPVQSNAITISCGPGDLYALYTLYGNSASGVLLLHKTKVEMACGTTIAGMTIPQRSASQGLAPLNLPVGTASVQVCPGNILRKKLILTNDSPNVIYINPFGNPAVVGQGIRLNPNGGTYDDEHYTWLAHYAISTAPGSNLCIAEFS